MKIHYSIFWSTFITLLVLPFSVFAQSFQKLTGSIISDSFASSSNPASYAFDGDEDSFYMSSQISHAWVGLDLGTRHVITGFRWLNKVGTYEMKFYIPWYNKTVQMPYSYQAIIEGANRSDFSDAIPIYMIRSESVVPTWQEATINTTRGFRYVRYVGPNSSAGQVCEIEFYGVEGEGNDSKLYQITNLPTVNVHITTGNDPVNKTEELNAFCSVISQSGTKVVDDDCTFRLRGNTSMEFDKKPYRLKFAEKHKMPDCSYKAKKWSLIPNLDDKSLMRNVIGFDVNRSVGLEYTPYCHSVDLVLNGEYKGNYQLCDLVSVSNNRIDVEEIDSEIHFDASQFGWFIEIDKLANKEPTGSWFNSAKGIPVTVKSPDSKEINSSYLATIKSHFDKMESCVYTGQIDSVTGYRRYLDMDSFVRYFLASEFVVNSDAYHSMFLHKHVNDDKFYVGPLWDLNLTLNNDNRFYDVNKRTRWTYHESSADAGTIRTFLLKMMEYDPDVIQEAKNLWTTLRQTNSITTERLLSVVDSMAMVLQESQELNFKRWNILKDRIFANMYSYGSYSGEVEALRSAISGRVSWMDGMLNCVQNDVEIVIPDGGWTTIYYPLSCDIPEGLSCYSILGVEREPGQSNMEYSSAIVSAILDGESQFIPFLDLNEDGMTDVGDIIKIASKTLPTLILQKEAVIQANRPYLINGNSGTYILSGYQTDACDGGRNGIMIGTSAVQNISEGAYVLTVKSDRVAFQKVDEGMNCEIAPNRAYILLPESAGDTDQSVLYFPIDVLGGIEEVSKRNQTETSVYSTDGRLLFKSCSYNLNISKVIRQLDHGVYILETGTQQKKVVF